jgi:NhaC family Na+:H+ antiporter
MSDQSEREPIGLAVALVPVIFLIVALAMTIGLLGLQPHIPLIAAAAVAGLVAVVHGVHWKAIEDGMVHGINLAMGAILILMVVGTMIGTWILGGVVPTMIYYGLEILSPGIFLVATMLICSIVSLGTGSSWSTAGTVGVALIGVGAALQIPLPMVAGAIISGAYFGDKMSPLSDTTNLAPAMAGTDVFSHIRHMVYTTGPGYVIALILYGIIGIRYAGGHLETNQLTAMLDVMQGNFFIHPVLLLPPALVIAMVVLRIPPLPALLGGTLIGGICAVAFQSGSIADVIAAAHSGYVLRDRRGGRRRPPEPGWPLEHDGDRGPHHLRALVWRNHGAHRDARGHRRGATQVGEEHRLAGDDYRAERHRDERGRLRPVHGDRDPRTDVQECVRQARIASQESFASVGGLGDTHLATDPLEQLRRIHVGDARRVSAGLRTVRFHEPVEPDRVDLLRIHGHYDGEAG